MLKMAAEVGKSLLLTLILELDKIDTKKEYYGSRCSMKKKKILVVAIILALVLLLTPVRMNLKDGGSVKYQALVYEVTMLHRLSNAGGETPYIDGIEVKILGMTVYRQITPIADTQ